MDPSQMMPRSFPMWAPPPPPAPSDAMPPPPLPFLPLPPPNRGWKRKNPNNNSNTAYQPPAIGDLQVQNRAKARRWFKNPNNNPNNPNRKYFFRKPKAAAPRNTTSFIIRAKRAGGIASLVSPCPVTPAVLPTPVISPSREGLSDMAQEQWGVDGYGSMKGLIRLRSSPQPPNANANGSDDEVEETSSGSDVEEHVEVERRLDHDLSRFEMVYPGRGEEAGGYLLEDDDEYDQDVHVARLEEENLTLKERLFLMEQEVGDMRRRLEAIEARFAGAGSGENAVAEVLENGAERANAVGVADDAVEVALENGTERANAVDVADSAVEGALENGTERANAVGVAHNAVEAALENGTERANAVDVAENAVEGALEKGDTDVDNAVEEALKNGLESAVGADEGLKNDTKMGDAAADADKTVEQASESVTEKVDAASGADNAVEESVENDMGSAAVEPEKSCNYSEKNAATIDAGSSKDNGEERKQA